MKGTGLDVQRESAVIQTAIDAAQKIIDDIRAMPPDVELVKACGSMEYIRDQLAELMNHLITRETCNDSGN